MARRGHQCRCCGGCFGDPQSPINKDHTEPEEVFFVATSEQAGWVYCKTTRLNGYSGPISLLAFSDAFQLLSSTTASGEPGGYFFKPQGVSTVFVSVTAVGQSVGPLAWARTSFYCPKQITRSSGVGTFEMNGATPVEALQVEVTSEDYFYTYTVREIQNPYFLTNQSEIQVLGQLWQGSLYAGTFSLLWDQDSQTFRYYYPFSCSLPSTPFLEIAISPKNNNPNNGPSISFSLKNAFFGLHPWSIARLVADNQGCTRRRTKYRHSWPNTATFAEASAQVRNSMRCENLVSASASGPQPADDGQSVAVPYPNETTIDATDLQSVTPVFYRDYERISINWLEPETSFINEELARASIANVFVPRSAQIWIGRSEETTLYDFVESQSLNGAQYSGIQDNDEYPQPEDEYWRRNISTIVQGTDKLLILSLGNWFYNFSTGSPFSFNSACQFLDLGNMPMIARASLSLPWSDRGGDAKMFVGGLVAEYA